MKTYKIHCKTINPEQGDIQQVFEENDKQSALNFAMWDIYATLGHGDGDNGGVGSLWHCASSILTAISNGEHYSYADKEWWVEEEEVEMTEPKKFTIHLEAVVGADVEVIADSENEAFKNYKENHEESMVNNLNNALKHSAHWRYDINNAILTNIVKED